MSLESGAVFALMDPTKSLSLLADNLVVGMVSRYCCGTTQLQSLSCLHAFNSNHNFVIREFNELTL